jgi:hypothetical protein
MEIEFPVLFIHSIAFMHSPNISGLNLLVAISGLSILFHRTTCVPFNQYYSALIIRATDKSLR